ncbi:MAG: hypothetical protein RI955_869 [Bacteroidota bacterium]
MNIQSQKLKIIEEIVQLNDEQKLNDLENLLHHNPTEAFKPMTEPEFYKMIEESELDIQQGKTMLHEDVVEYFKKKLK